MGAPQYEQAGADVAGSGTTNTIPRWTGPTTLGDSLITQTLAGAPFEATRIRVATGVDTYAWFRDSVPSGNVLFVAANAAFGMYKGLEIASAGTYFTSGNVGVGTTSPSTRLHVSDNSSIPVIVQSSGSTDSYLRFINTSNNLGYIGYVGTNLYLAPNNGAGNVGIGTTSPAARLHSVVADGSYQLAVSGTTRGARFETNATETRLVGVDNTLSASFQPLSIGGSTVIVRTNGTTQAAIFDASGNVVINTAAIATNATNGFLYVPSCAGTPTGTPTTYTGRVPIVVDTTNNKLYFYSGGAWRDAGP